MYNIIFPFFILSFSLFSHSQKPLSPFIKNGSLQNLAIAVTDLIWELFFVRFSLEILGVKMGMKRLLVFFFNLICVGGGFEGCRRVGGVWAVLCWWFWSLLA